MAESTRPALAQDTACSVLRPPNTTATRTFPVTRPPSPETSPETSPDEPTQKPASRPAEGLQGHVCVGDQVLGVLQANGEAYRSRVNPAGRERAVVQLAVGGGGHVAHHRVRPAQ